MAQSHMMVALFAKVHTLQFTRVVVTPITPHTEAFLVPLHHSFPINTEVLMKYFLWLYQK